MKLFSKLFSNVELIKGGACPNCWGEQEYDNQARELIKDKQIDVNNHEAKHAFIQEFVTNHVSGISLQKGDNSHVCNRCKALF